MPQKDFELILRVQADLQQAVSQLRTLNDQMRVTKSAAVEASGGLATIRGSAAAAESGIRNVGTQATALNSKLGLINRTAHDLRNAFIFAFAIHEVVDFTKSLVDANVEAQRIQNTMEQAFGKDGAAQQLQFVRDLAEKLGLDFKAAAESFAGFGASAQGTGIQTADLRKLFVGLSEAATVLHSSTQDVNGVMIQLGQAMSLGKLQMQDIRAIAQHLPGTMTALSEAAKRMGTNLTDALKSGGLAAQQFIGALGDVLHERFGQQAVEASHSLNAELNRLRSTLFNLQTDGTGFATQFAGAIRSLNTTLNDPSLKEGLRNLITGLGDIASEAVVAAGTIGKMVAGIASMAQYAAFLKTGYVDQDQTLVQQENEFNALIAKRERLKQSLNDLTWVERKLGLGGHLEAELADVTKQIQAAQDAHKTSQIAQGQAQQHAIDTAAGSVVDDILAPKTKPNHGTTPDPAALRRAAELAKQAATAQDALTKSLIDMQAQLDPTAAIYAKYNDAVKKATDEAELAKQAHGANAQAIDAQRDAVIALAAKVRDAALDQLAEKDRQAWEALKRSFETPAQVRVDDALKQIQQLNDLLAKGVITAQQYHDALGQIGQKSVAGALPTYQGLDATVGGPYGELQKNYEAQAKLDAAYQAQKLALDQKFNDQDEAQHAAHIAALNDLDKQRAAEQKKIDDARGTLQLNAASELFGQLATLSSSHNKKMAAIGKAAAIAQAIITTYKSANDAFSAMASIPYIGPVLGAAAAAAAIVAGLANVAQIRNQNVGGYAEGGYTGAGGKYQVAGVVHAGEGVLSAVEVKAIGGEAGFKRLRSALRGYADGGFVVAPHPLANAPSPAAMGFAAPTPLPVGSLPGAARDDNAHAREPLTIRNVLVMDPDVIPGAMTGQRGERVTMTHIKANIPTLRAWINGKG